MAKYVRGSGKTGRVNWKRVNGGWRSPQGKFFTDEQRKAQKRGKGKTGRVNLERVEGGWKNASGVVFTDAERRQFRNATKASNAKRAAEIAAWKERPHMVGSKELSQDRTQLSLMGKETDFIVAHQHGDIQKFKTKEEFAKYMRKQEHIASGDYERDKIRLYKKNFVTALENVYGDEATDVINRIKAMRLDVYQEALSDDERLEIRYAPSDKYEEGRLDEIREAIDRALEERRKRKGG